MKMFATRAARGYAVDFIAIDAWLDVGPTRVSMSGATRVPTSGAASGLDVVSPLDAIRVGDRRRPWHRSAGRTGVTGFHARTRRGFRGTAHGSPQVPMIHGDTKNVVLPSGWGSRRR